jgi:hypothetical protein
VAVRHLEAVQWLQGSVASAESRPGRIGPITLEVKQAGERSAGNPHAAFDVAGAGNVARSRCCDTSQPKGRGNREHKLRPKPARQSPTLLLGGTMETAASFEVRNAPSSYPAGRAIVLPDKGPPIPTVKADMRPLPQRANCCREQMQQCACTESWLYSITSSARAIKDDGIFNPNALAVFRLMINSTFVTCWTGKVAGFSPLRIRPA